MNIIFSLLKFILGYPKNSAAGSTNSPNTEKKSMTTSQQLDALLAKLKVTKDVKERKKISLDIITLEMVDFGKRVIDTDKDYSANVYDLALSALTEMYRKEMEIQMKEFAFEHDLYNQMFRQFTPLTSVPGNEDKPGTIIPFVKPPKDPIQ